MKVFVSPANLTIHQGPFCSQHVAEVFFCLKIPLKFPSIAFSGPYGGRVQDCSAVPSNAKLV